MKLPEEFPMSCATIKNATFFVLRKVGVRLLLFCLMLFVVCFQSEAQKKLEEIKTLREKMKEVADEARGKEDIYKQLVMHLTTSEC